MPEKYEKNIIMTEGYSQKTALLHLMLSEWMKWVDPKLHKKYDSLRAELLSVPFYAEMKNKMLLNKNNC